MMARDRYNFLDIHGLCDPVTFTFPNGFSYFLSLPDFPEVGVGDTMANPRYLVNRDPSDEMIAPFTQDAARQRMFPECSYGQRRIRPDA
jgi:hypothetical protein